MQDYEELTEILTTSGAGIHASECHGFLCALICGNGQAQEQKIREFFLLDTDEIVNPEECFNQIHALALETREKLYSAELELELLLASEESELAVRSRSLAEWCQGFMSGLGLSALKQEQIPTESQEIISDFYQIARLDSGNKGDSSDEDDFALMELVEYVRMGAIFIFEDLQENAELVRSKAIPDDHEPEVLH